MNRRSPPTAVQGVMCEVPECGALVYHMSVAGKRMAVNPVEMEVVARTPEGEFSLVRGYQPHYVTCVDLMTRPERI